MKLGTGKNKYKIKFKYVDTNRVSIKNVYVDDVEEAKKLFSDIYANYNIEILQIEKIQEEN